MIRRFSFMSLLLFLMLIGLAGQPTQAESSANHAIKLHSRVFTPEAGIEANLLANERTQASSTKQHVLLQLHAIPTAAQRATLAASGIELLGYIPNNAWLASVQTPVVLNRGAQSLIRWVGALLPADKLSPALRQNGVASWAREENGEITLQLLFFEDVSQQAAKQLIARYEGEVVLARQNTSYVVRFASASVVEQLAAEDLVQWVENGPAPKRLRDTPSIESTESTSGRVPQNDGARVRTNVDALQTAHPDATGSGTRLGVWDGGVDPSHPDFTGRLWVDPDHSEPADSHGTHVAGTMAGDGRNSINHGGTANQWRGIATAAQVFSYDNNNNNKNQDWFMTHQHAIQTNNVDLSQNSWGGNFTSETCDTHNIYSQESLDMDTIVLGSEYGKAIVSSVAASNFREGTSDNKKEKSPICGYSDSAPFLNYTSLSDLGSAKNILSVGATKKNETDEMGDFSSWGPTRDGRIKPDIVAPGEDIRSAFPGGGYENETGTSMATPHISGIAALIIQRYRSVFNTQAFRPATIRAILIHTAKDLKDHFVYYTTGPDYASGYGIADALAAYEIVKTSNIFEEQVANGANQSKQLTVTSSSTPLKVTLVWDDPLPQLNAQSQLINNLDLELVGPDGSTHQPWILDPMNPRNAATTGVDNRNNVEQVYVASPTTGDWTIQVKGTSIPEGPQAYTLVVSSQPASTGGNVKIYLPLVIR